MNFEQYLSAGVSHAVAINFIIIIVIILEKSGIEQIVRYMRQKMIHDM